MTEMQENDGERPFVRQIRDRGEALHGSHRRGEALRLLRRDAAGMVTP